MTQPSVAIVGIDLSTTAVDTGIAVALWQGAEVELLQLLRGSDGQKSGSGAAAMRQIKTAVAEACVGLPEDTQVLYAIDVPMGWPAGFAAALCGAGDAGGEAEFAWRSERPESDAGALRPNIVHRVTDRLIWRAVEKRPYSVSTDKIGVTAMAARELIHELGAPHLLVPGSATAGSKAVIEVYPEATFLSAHLRKGPKAARSLKQTWHAKKGDGIAQAQDNNEGRLQHAVTLISNLADLVVEPQTARIAAGTSRRISEHEWDALWCLVAGVEFLSGYSMVGEDVTIPPDVLATEGFIWCRSTSPNTEGTRFLRFAGDGC